MSQHQSETQRPLELVKALGAEQLAVKMDDVRERFRADDTP